MRQAKMRNPDARQGLEDVQDAAAKFPAMMPD
jgi:hypothetical protein